MNWKTMLAAAALTGLAGSHAIHQASAADERITTEQEFRATAVGKKMVTKGGYVNFGEDGSLSGEFSGKKLTGKWSWEDGYFCRTVKLGGKDRGHDCQVVLATEDGVVLHRKKGQGKKSAPYRAE